MNNENRRDKIIKYTFNKYGTYISLIKDVKLLEFFINRTDKEVRQKTIIDYFSCWSPKTVRRHLDRLVQKEIIKESHEFRGTYIFHPGYHQNMKFDMDNIARVILGEELYEMAKSCWKIKEDEKLSEEQEAYERNFGINEKRYVR